MDDDLKQEIVELLKSELRISVSTDHEYGDGDSTYVRVKLMLGEDCISEDHAWVS